MVRAIGLLMLASWLVAAGCGRHAAPPQVEVGSVPFVADEALEPDVDIAALPPLPFAEPAASVDREELVVELDQQATEVIAATNMDVDAAPAAVELSDFGEQTAPRNDLMATIGSFSGTGVAGRGEAARGALTRYAGGPSEAARAAMVRQMGGNSADPVDLFGYPQGAMGDKFSSLDDSEFHAVKETPLTTFSVDVDTASYSKIRMYLLERRRMPPREAVRIEELINYFDYDYAGPDDDKPFAVHLETAECPWQPQHRLVRCALQGKKLDGKRPDSNLVFLVDVSGSMDYPNKLPLVQRALGMLVGQLGEKDRVSMVVYAGTAGLVLPPTNGSEHAKILAAVQALRAGGSTNGGQGIQQAYRLAQENFIKGGTNRVILCTDGDFNVGVTNTDELVKLAAEQAQGGIYLSVLGFGIGNHNDALLEELSNRANGNYAFVDNDLEARKVFVEQVEGTLVTIAKDVKIQVEFNPAQVAAYRLIGYENRQLANKDFNDDKKDAGDIGAGHRVTALYEIIPANIESEFSKPPVDPLKYQAPRAEPAAKPMDLTPAAQSGELLTLKLRFQPPAGGASALLSFAVKDSGQRFGAASKEFQFAASVASFGMLLKNSRHKGSATYASVLETAVATRGADKHGLRNEFLQMVTAAQGLSDRRP